MLYLQFKLESGCTAIPLSLVCGHAVCVRRVGHCARLTSLSRCTCGYPKESEVEVDPEEIYRAAKARSGTRAKRTRERPHNVAF